LVLRQLAERDLAPAAIGRLGDEVGVGRVSEAAAGLDEPEMPVGPILEQPTTVDSAAAAATKRVGCIDAPVGENSPEATAA
jgi:hypothetical protein